MLQVLTGIWNGKVTTKSDLSRHYADEIAEAASRGWITTVVPLKRVLIYGRQWRMTSLGLRHLETTLQLPSSLDCQTNGRPNQTPGRKPGKDCTH